MIKLIKIIKYTNEMDVNEKQKAIYIIEILSILENRDGKQAGSRKPKANS